MNKEIELIRKVLSILDKTITELSRLMKDIKEEHVSEDAYKLDFSKKKPQ